MTAEYFERLSQPAEKEAIIKRLMETISVQKSIATEWAWDEKDVAAWEADLEDIRNSVGAGTYAGFFAAELAWSTAEGLWRRALSGLHAATVRGVAIARVRWREVPERRPLVARLRARATTPEGILEEALAWEVAWQKIEPDLVPIPGLTLAAFQTQHAAARALERPLAEAAAGLPSGGGALRCEAGCDE